jgi:plasmid stabilization system protein ParE
MSSFVLHPGAVRDLEDIWEYIGARSIEAADRVLEEIYGAISELVAFPYQGHVRLDLSSRPIRFQVVRSLLIAYAPQEKPLLILAVIDGRRHPRVLAALLRERT